MKRKVVLELLFVFFTVAAFAQIEHGVLVGAGAGFSMNDDPIYTPDPCFGYNNQVKINSMVGYRCRFLMKSKNFIDLDATIGFQWMEVYKFTGNQIGDFENVPPGEYVTPPGHTFTDYIMPLSVTASWNYQMTDRFYTGVGVLPILYIQPQTVFDLAFQARIGYKVSRRLELGLSYHYGVLDVQKHFNNGPAMGRRGHFSDLTLSAYIPFSIK